MTKKEIAIQYVKDYGDIPKIAIARRIVHDHPILFKSVEDARLYVRLVTGAAGEKNKNNSNPEIAYMGNQSVTNNYGIPKSYEQVWEPYVMPSEEYLLLSDIHLPYHSVKALEAAFDYGIKNGIKNVILNGDTLDFYQVSNFEKNPNMRRFVDELECWYELADSLVDNFPGQIVFKEGNHEERYGKLLQSRAPELLGVNEYKIENILHLDQYNFDFISEKRPMHFGGLTVLHGHEYSFGVFSPVNVARGLFLRAKTSSICGHHHQTSQHQEGNVRGTQTITYSVGCLSELHPAYMRLNKWNHGFAHIQRTGNDFEVNNFRVNENGKVYR